MSCTKLLFLLAVPAALFPSESLPWRDKPAADWTDDDVHRILTDSPWSKTVQPKLERSANTGQRQSRGGRGGGINMGGIGIGLPGTGGMGRRGGGYPGGGYPGGPAPGGGQEDHGQPPALRLRWESALPVRAAELKGHEANIPAPDEEHYAIAVYGVPERFVQGASAGQLKKQATIKREGKGSLKPSSVDVIQAADGPVLLYLFPRSKEITRQDKRLEFDAKIGRMELTQPFFVEDMIYQGKLEL